MCVIVTVPLCGSDVPKVGFSGVPNFGFCGVPKVGFSDVPPVVHV